jgi:hypothetical protein
MKKIFILLITAFPLAHSQAQGLSNFFSQSEADIKYMLQQIAALQVYIGYAEKGYSIAQQGLTFIGELKKGEFDLHSAFFSSLKAVNPSIANYAKVADIISYQESIVKDFKKILQLKNMNPAEINYLNSVYNNMSSECTKSLNDLINLITNDTYEMKDNERVHRIDEIYSDMKDKYAFTQSFTSEAGMLSLNRSSETGDTGTLSNLYNLK